MPQGLSARPQTAYPARPGRWPTQRRLAAYLSTRSGGRRYCERGPGLPAAVLAVVGAAMSAQCRRWPSPGSLPAVPDRLRGELGAGGHVELGEHVHEMGLHGLA